MAPETNTPARFLVPAQQAPDLGLDSRQVEELLDALAHSGVAIDPTLAVIEVIFTSRAGQVPRGFQDLARRLPHHVQEFLRSGQGLTHDAETLERYERSFAAMREMTRGLHKRGVAIPPGSDSVAGFALHRELELYVESGIPPGDVLALATLGAARLTGMDARLGRIAPGLLADFVVIDGNPLEDFASLRKVELVARGGRLFCPAEIAVELGIALPTEDPDASCGWMASLERSSSATP